MPDEVIPEVFRDEVAPRLRSGACVCFASGYVVAYGLVEPPDGVDVLLLAPRMLGEEVRRTYLDGSGFLSYVSVERDATGKAKARLLGLAGAAGSLRRGALELTAAKEALLDLFVEQGFGAYRGFLRTTEIDMAAMQRHFGEILADIQSGGFARRFQDEQANGYPTLAAIQSITSGQDPMTKAEERVREALAPEPDQAGQRP